MYRTINTQTDFKTVYPSQSLQFYSDYQTNHTFKIEIIHIQLIYWILIK